MRIHAATSLKLAKNFSVLSSKMHDPDENWFENLSPDLWLAVRSAQAAGTVIREGTAGLRTDLIEEKGVGDLVSQIDRDADLASTSVLRNESDLPILSEELNHEVQEQDTLWIVDPLDGSSAFLMQAGAHYPSVLIAKIEAGKTAVGVCYFPLTGEWYYAQGGRGAWKNGKRLVCDSSESLSEVWVEMNQYGDASYETRYFRELNVRLRSKEGARLVTSSVPHAGVAVRIAERRTPLAAAIHDNNAASTKQGPWDIAAPQLILEEAGGTFLNPNGHVTDPFHCEPIIVARSRTLGEEIVELGAHEIGKHQPSA